MPSEGAGSDVVHLVCGFDEGYARAAGVMIRSVARTLRPGVRGVAHVVGLDLTEESRARLLGCGSDALEIRMVDFDPAWLEGLPEPRPGEAHLNATVYICMLADRFLPPEVERYVKLDCDMIVRSSVDELAFADIGDAIVGGVRDFYIPAAAMKGGVSQWRRLGLDSRGPYVNGGMMVVDRPSWVAKDIEANSLRYLHEYREHVQFLEQEALNVTLAGHWMPLHPRWNFQVMLDEFVKNGEGWVYAFVDGTELDEARANPSIVHFTMPVKPWHQGADMPFRDEWWEVAADTPFASAPPAERRPTAMREVKRRIRHAARVLRRGE
jgi:lipopolysaccharide biosynthesis glycosyltransferase